MTLAQFLDAQCRSRGWKPIHLFQALQARNPADYKGHQRVYAWFSDGGISPDAARDVAEVLKLDADERRVFAQSAGFGAVVDLLNSAA